MAKERNFWSLIKPDQDVTVCPDGSDHTLLFLSYVSHITIVFRSREGSFEVLFKEPPKDFNYEDVYILAEVKLKFDEGGRSMKSIPEPDRIFTGDDAEKVLNEIVGWKRILIEELLGLLSKVAYN